MFRYTIDPTSDQPIYRQLADQIRAQIRSGALPTGTQLPTVREMAEKLHLSCGTVKHVYDRLQEMGDIEMTRRKGTFVKYVRRDQDSRKQQAMNAIDQMIRKMTDLQFSPAEIQIFLNLKMREWGLRWSGIRIAVVAEYPETAAALERQLSCIGNVQVNVYPLAQLREYPYNIDEQNDVILASSEDAQTLSQLLPDASKVIRVAFQPDPAAIAALASCTKPKIGIVCEDGAYAKLVEPYLPQAEECIVFTSESTELEAADALVTAEGFMQRCSSEMQQKLEHFRQHKPVYEFSYRLDDGSMLYLEERINRIRDERQHWPGALRL